MEKGAHEGRSDMDPCKSYGAWLKPPHMYVYIHTTNIHTTLMYIQHTTHTAYKNTTAHPQIHTDTAHTHTMHTHTHHSHTQIHIHTAHTQPAMLKKLKLNGSTKT